MMRKQMMIWGDESGGEVIGTVSEERESESGS